MTTEIIARPDITLTPVESSQIHAIGYDAQLRILAVQFKAKAGPGSIYHYDNVPPEIHQEMLAAKSIGRYFGTNIKAHRDDYPHTKIEPPKADRPADDVQ